MIGQWKGQDVGCFVVTREPDENEIMSGNVALRIPVVTLHRVTRELAIAGVVSMAVGLQYDHYQLHGVENECHCLGAAAIEMPGVPVVVRR